MIFAAGLGTRLKPLTQDKPKALVEISGKSLLERCINYLKSHGITEVVINVHHFSNQVIDFITQKENFGIDIHISDESNSLLDTGGGLLKAQKFLDGDEPILIINVDILTDLNLEPIHKHHLEESALATLVVRERSSSRYLLFNEENQLVGWTNTKTGEIKKCTDTFPSRYCKFAFSGIQIIQPQLLKKITETGKFSIIDLYLRLAKIEKIVAYLDSNSNWMDLGKYNELAKAEELIRKLSN